MTTAIKKMASLTVVPFIENAEDTASLLSVEHRTVRDLFVKYVKARTPLRKKKLVEQICSELSMYGHVEERILYPAVRLSLKDRVRTREVMTEQEFLEEVMA
jgi:hypothetical protein